MQPTVQLTGVQFKASVVGDNLRIASVFIMFFVSLLGVALPLLYYGSNPTAHKNLAESDNFRIMRSFAAGIMIAVAFIHLLFDGNEKLSEVSIEYPSLAFTLATIGIMIALGFEQVAVAINGGVKIKEESPAKVYYQARCEENCAEINTSNDIKDNLTSFGIRPHQLPEIERQMELEAVGQNATHSAICEHNLAISMISGSETLTVIVKAYMMEISIAIHSVVIGIGLGNMSGEENLPPLKALIIALTFHQFFEGLGLGTTLQEARVELGKLKIIIFVITFASTLSIGIIIGILLALHRHNNDEHTIANESYVTGCFNSLAAGVLIYVSLVEMAAEDFHAVSISHRGLLKVKMMLALMTGTLILAVLARWA